MSELKAWLKSNRNRLERAGFTLETGGSDEVFTVVGETPIVGFSLIEWPGLAVEFNAMSYVDDKVISVVEANSQLSVKDKCDYYLNQIEIYIAGLSY